MDPGRPAGRGRGRGFRGRSIVPSLEESRPAPLPAHESDSGSDRRPTRVNPPSENVAGSSREPERPSTSVGRGRGRGKVSFPIELLEVEPRTPIAFPLREREDPEEIQKDSDEDDDFFTAFRKMHPGRPSGAGRGRGTLGIQVLQNYPVEPGVLSPQSTLSPTPSLTPSSSKSSSEEVGSDDFSEMEKSVVIMKGQHGEKVQLCANFIRLKILRSTGLFEYHTYFDPSIESRRIKWRILKDNECYIHSTFNFDGAKLYLPVKLPSKITEFMTVHPYDSSLQVKVTVKFVKVNSLDDCVHFYNVLLRRIMLILGMVEMSRNFYDYRIIYDLPIHKLHIWPGYVTAVDLNEGGLMLCCDSSFKVLRTDTMLDAYYRFYESDPNDYQQRFKDYVLGKIILTRYNKKNYRIDDVDWTRSPRSTFIQGQGNREREISFVDYYKENYDQVIRDKDQPMLVTRGKIKRQTHDLAPPPVILLVPELCYVTGLTEDITSNYKTMKDIAQFTRITPENRYLALMKFISNVNETPNAKQVFTDWGLELDSATVDLEGRVIKPPPIIMNNDVMFNTPKGDFSSIVMKNKIYEPVHIKNWLLLFPRQDEQKAMGLLRNYRSVSEPLGINYRADARTVSLTRTTPDEYRRALVANIQPGITQFVVVIVQSARDDIYRVIKVICNREIPIPSQVIRSKTLGDERRGRSVMQKIALQINCKLGGSLWRINIPLPEKIMFIGMDVYHDPKRRNASVTGVVASINGIHTKYYSRVIFQSSQQEAISSLRPVMMEFFEAFYEENGAFPDRVIVFRDGVGDGQLEITKQHEVAQMLGSLDICERKPKFTFCVVQKRINARMYLKTGDYIGNPEPGTVMDYDVTRRYFFDFFLVSQLIREGTVNPTHYIVLFDDAGITADMMQKFAYATSYMYYNWTGSIRVPAMCQYAHKLAGLAGQYMRVEPAKELCKKLYFL